MGIVDINTTTSGDRAEIVLTDEATGEYASVNEKRTGVNALETIPSVASYQGFKIASSFSDTTLSQTYINFINITGKGLLAGFKFDFSNDQVDIRLVIDGSTSFELDLRDIRNMNFAGFNNSGLNRFFGTDQFGELEFFPNFPIAFNTSIQVQAKKQVSWNIDVDRYLILYTEEL